MATSNADGGYKRFSGAGGNGRDLNRWKTWCLSKMITMTTLTKEARGPFVYSMLNGDALTAVDHLEFAEFVIDGVENQIFNILEARYPDKDPIDRAGKALFDEFEVSAREGERLSEWSGCSTLVREMQAPCSVIHDRCNPHKLADSVTTDHSIWATTRSLPCRCIRCLLFTRTRHFSYQSCYGKATRLGFNKRGHVWWLWWLWCGRGTNAAMFFHNAEDMPLVGAAEHLGVRLLASPPPRGLKNGHSRPCGRSAKHAAKCCKMLLFRSPRPRGDPIRGPPST